DRLLADLHVDRHQLLLLLGRIDRGQPGDHRAVHGEGREPRCLAPLAAHSRSSSGGFLLASANFWIPARLTASIACMTSPCGTAASAAITALRAGSAAPRRCSAARAVS